MELFGTVFFKIIPLYFVIGLGYVAVRFLKAARETVAKLLVFLIAPAVVFYGAATVELNGESLSLPLVLLAAGCLIGAAFYRAGLSAFGEERTASILGFAAGTGNTGYFGIPVAVAALGAGVFPRAVLATLGLILYENTLGLYFVARGTRTVRESLKLVARMPAIYAFALGLAVNVAGLRIDAAGAVQSLAASFKGAYSVLGMMIIGMGLAAVTARSFDWKFIAGAFLAKFLAWPAFMLLLFLADARLTHIFSAETMRLLFLLSVVPIAANTVTYAELLDAHPEKAAAAVFLSTLASLILIPAALLAFDAIFGA